MLAITSPIRKQVLLRLARFIGLPASLDQSGTYRKGQLYDEVVQQACDYINSQREELEEMTIRRDLLTIEVRHLEDELKWLEAVLVAANINLADYDHLRKKRDD